MSENEIPARFYLGIEKLAKADDQYIELFFEVLKYVSPSTSLSELLDSITERFFESKGASEGRDKAELTSLIEFLISLVQPFSDYSFEAEFFAQLITRQVKNDLSGSSDLSLSDENLDTFEERLEYYFKLDESLKSSIKLSRIFNENDNVLSEISVNTDLMPLGSLDESMIKAFGISHRIKISFEGDSQPMHITCDSKGIQVLIEVLQDAQKREDLIKDCLKDSGVDLVSM